MMWRVGLLLILTAQIRTEGKIESEEDVGESGERAIAGDYNVTRNNTQPKEIDIQVDDSGEHIGAAITQVFRQPYAGALLKNDTYVCSAVVLNTYWVLTLSKCFESNVISSYVTHRYLENYTIRTGSSYNNKGGFISKIKMLINNFDLKVSAAKLHMPLEFNSQVQSVLLPRPEDEVALGYLASMVAWTPTGHIRIVNAPVIDPTICEPSTKLLPGRYICISGVQDPNRHFCRKDNGGAVVQNNTLIAVSSFLHTCALYTKTHAFPKIASFSRWLNSVIWDENNQPTTIITTTKMTTVQTPVNTTESRARNTFLDTRNFMLTLPFDPINVPLEPAEDNSVIPRMSLYESYLQNLAKSKTSTTADPNKIEDEKREWIKKFGKSILMMPPQFFKKYDNFDYK